MILKKISNKLEPLANINNSNKANEAIDSSSIIESAKNLAKFKNIENSAKYKILFKSKNLI